MRTMQLKCRDLKHYQNLATYNKYADIIALLPKEFERFLTLSEFQDIPSFLSCKY